MQVTQLAERLKRDFAGYTPAGKRVASYLLANLHQLPFETADGIAARTGIAGITVGRFLRQLGYQNLDELKKALRGARPWLMTDRLGSFRAHAANEDALELSLQMEKQAIEHSYGLTRTPEFQRVVEGIAGADAVFLVGIQSTRGIVNSLFCHLEYIRPRVYYVDGLSGTYVESLNSEYASPYVVITDLSAYSVMTRRLCAAACARGIGTALIGDKYCTWAHDYPVDLLQLETDAGQFWDTLAPLCCLFNLIADAVITRLGDRVDQRLVRNKMLQKELGQFEL
jgi:DNA-binding MurR/RpiR family transcriptional regulator